MTCQKEEFQLDPNVTYLNASYMTPQLKSVEEAGIMGLQRKRNPHRITGEMFFGETEELRKAFAKVIRTPEPERIAVIPSVSYGMANVAANLNLDPGQKIIVAGEQFPSNVYPWREVAHQTGAEIVTVNPPSESRGRGSAWNERILDAVDTDTALIALSHIHWADGTLFNLKAIRERTDDVDALLVIDGTQSVGALPFDVTEIRPDALVCAGYKWLLGPYSIGMAYYGPAFDGGRPVEENWINRYESENFANLVNYNDRYQPGALRYEVGEHSNFILIPMMLDALHRINRWGLDSIQEYCRSITDPGIEELREAGYRIEEDDFRASHMFGIRLREGQEMNSVQSSLTDENVIVSFRGDSIRVSPHLYNEASDMEKLVRALTSLVYA
ncbi:MAG: aminotransferase class V-fold PLP-dependent enzyme [Bacteroidetes bacterium]|nr:aminotransferase class V-fold PLP-dependent enzyme [Bacteroidota bacterium]